ncbi:MAG: hypothetical protein ABJR46_14100 [Tateyamaria sp.]|uniref:hypothetical protein n=1 Tax=Tateyamaria sp. TaxID=1929288 RepID=UPI00329E945F
MPYEACLERVPEEQRMYVSKVTSFNVKHREKVGAQFAAPALQHARPTRRFYEKFGISGCSLLYTRRGQVAVKDLLPNDELVSFASGFVKPKTVLRPYVGESEKNNPTSLTIKSGSYRSNTPQIDVIVGKNAAVKMSYSPSKNNCHRLITPELHAFKHLLRNLCGNHAQLYIPVCEERTAIQIGGVYVVCPGKNDLDMELGSTL